MRPIAQLTVAVIRWQEPQVSRVGVAPTRVLHVVAVTIVGAVLARLARKIHLQRALVGQHRVADVHRGHSERDLLFGQLQSVF